MSEVVVEFASPPNLARGARRRRERGGASRSSTGARARRADDAPHRSRARRSSRWGSGTPTRSTISATSRGCSASTGSAACTATDETFDAGARRHRRRAVYNPRPDDPPGHRRAARRRASWVAESFPAESVEELPDGGQRVVLAVSETAWLERVLLQVGPEAVVVDPPEWRDAGRAAAARVRARYSAAGAAGA